MRIVRYLMEHKLALLLVVLLLCVQAFCDLSLPNYTSQIVDVGIQQAGVEDAVVLRMTDKTHDAIEVMLDGEDASLFADSYAQDADGAWSLTEAGEQARDALNDAISFPLTLVRYADQMEGVDLDAAVQAVQAGILSKAEVKAVVDAAYEQMAEAGDSILEQQAIAAAKAEYEAVGYDLDALQMNYLYTVGITMAVLAGVGMLASIAVSFLAARTGAKVGRDLRNRLFDRVVSFSDREINSFSAASLITRGTNDIQLIQMVAIMLQRMVLYAPILAIGGVIMVAQTNVSMSWIIALAIVVMLLALGILMALSMPKFKIMQKLIDRVNLVSREIITGLPVIRAFGRERHEQERFGQANTDLYRTQLFTNRVMTFMMPVMMLVMNATSVLIVWVGGQYINDGTIQTGDMIAFITYAMVIIMGFLMLGMMAVMLPRANVAAERIHEVISTQPSIVDPDVPRDAELAQSPGAAIEMADVCFSYAKDSENVLDHVSFTVEPGTTCAIIGPTGSGKSTVLKLIERFHDVTSGSVRIDGVDVRELSLHALHSALGYVPQKAFLFSGTVASNVSYSDDAMSPEQMSLALDVAQASDFVAQREGGLESIIAQGGTDVSGGQRQRLAIARALASDSRAFLFDDCFSALDYKTDAALREGIAKNLAGVTVLIVAQRIATIMHADKIVVLDEGRVVGCGTHEQLLQSCPLYLEIASSQLSEDELGVGAHASGANGGEA